MCNRKKVIAEAFFYIPKPIRFDLMNGGPSPQVAIQEDGTLTCGPGSKVNDRLLVVFTGVLRGVWRLIAACRGPLLWLAWERAHASPTPTAELLLLLLELVDLRPAAISWLDQMR